MVYRQGPATGLGGGNNVLALVNRKGVADPLMLPASGYDYPRVSRDGKRITYQIDDAKEPSIWIYDLSGATQPSRLTLPGSGSNRYPIWSPDGEWVAFESDREGDLGIWRQRADGNGVAERLTKPEKGESHIPDSWSSDGQFLSFTLAKGMSAAGTNAVWTLSLRDRKTTLFADAPAAWSSFSPVDIHWLAYSGDNHVYVKPFPSGISKYQAPPVRADHHTLWSPDGKELFYEPGNLRLVTVSVIPRPGSSLGFGAPMESSSGFNTHAVNNPRSYDILPNGKQFIAFFAAGSAVRRDAAAPGGSQLVRRSEAARAGEVENSAALGHCANGGDRALFFQNVHARPGPVSQGFSAMKCSAMGLPANFSCSRWEKSISALRGR
jgi:hypothetical protein